MRNIAFSIDRKIEVGVRDFLSQWLLQFIDFDDSMQVAYGADDEFIYYADKYTNLKLDFNNLKILGVKRNEVY